MDFINHWIPSEGSTEQLGGFETVEGMERV